MNLLPPAGLQSHKPATAAPYQLKRYGVPAGLSLDEKFEIWRSWYPHAVKVPIRLERTEKQLRADFNPSAVTLDGPGFGLIDVTNEPARGYWNGDKRAGDGLAYFRSSCEKFSVAGRSEEVPPGSVRFLDLSSAGHFDAADGLRAVLMRFDRHQLGMDDETVERLQGLGDISEHPLVRGLVVPALSGWQRGELAAEIHRLQPLVRSGMSALASSLLETPVPEEDLKRIRITEIKEYLRGNYRNQDLDVDQIAASSFMSRRALYNLFVEEELRISGYVRTLRTLAALELLTDVDSWRRSLSDTAAASGFSNLQAMRRALKESTGLSPREVQENPEVGRLRAAQIRKVLRS